MNRKIGRGKCVLDYMHTYIYIHTERKSHKMQLTVCYFVCKTTTTAEIELHIKQKKVAVVGPDEN